MLSFSPTFKLSYLSFLLKEKKNLNKKIHSLFCKNHEEKLYFFSRSSWAIASIVLFKKNSCIFIPDFYCDEAIFLLRKLKVNIIFYKLKLDNTIDIEDIKKKAKIHKPDVVLFCNYFGKSYFNSYLYDLKKKYDLWIIEDSTHCIKPINNSDHKGDFVIFSPYKMFPIPMGSVMVSKSSIKDLNLLNHLEDQFINAIKSSSLKLPGKKTNLIFFIKWFLKQFFKQLGINKLKIEHFESDNYINSEKELLNPQIGAFSKKLMIIFLLNSQKIINNRFQMFELVKKVIEQKKVSYSKSKNFNVNLNVNEEMSQNHPYMLEVNGNYQHIKGFYDYLKNFKFPVLTWPALPRQIKENNDTDNLAIKKRNSKFYIPLHYQPGDFIQNLSEEKKVNRTINFIKITEKEWIELFNKCEKKNIVNDISYLKSQKQILNINNTKYKILLNDNIVGIFALLEKKFFFIKYLRINRGPLFIGEYIDKNSEIDILKKISIFNFKNSFAFFKFSPEIKNFNHDLLIDNKKKTFLFDGDGWKSSKLDLKLDIIKIRENLSQKWRNSLNLFEKENILIKEESSEESIKIILNLYKDLQKQKKFKGINIKFLNNFLNNSKCLIYVGYLDNKFLGYICISTVSNLGTYLLGYANEQGRKVNVMNGLMWKAIVDLKEKQYSYLDLGGLDDLSTPGIFRFKSGVNAKEYKLAGSFKKIKWF